MAIEKEKLAQMVAGIADKLGDISVGLTQLATAIEEMPTGDDFVHITATAIDEDSVNISWTSSTADPVLRWHVDRDGSDLKGSGSWGTDLPATASSYQFNSLKPNVAYTFTVRGDMATSNVTSKITFTLSGPVIPPTTGGDGVTAASLLGWGIPDSISDEFEYTGDPDPSKWIPCGVKGVGWDGHTGNGRRMPENTTIANGMMIMRGDANGNTGWIRQKKIVTYGRWEMRSRSRNTGTSGGLYHPLGLIWPNPEKWPDNGELDFLEYRNPDAQQASAWLHYPHPKYADGHVEQAGDFAKNCDMTQFHNYAFEWTSTGVRAWIDGVAWYEVKDGGGPNGRKNIQAMPAGSLTIQLDNFTGDGGLRPAVFEIAWVRSYPV